MLGELIPQGGGDPIPLLQPKLVIGRRSSCDIVLIFPNISSQHCELELVNGYWQVRDLGSRNGVKVNGERVDSRFLYPGDDVAIAKNHYKIQYEPVGDAPPPPEEDPFAMGLLEKAGLERRMEEKRKTKLPPMAKNAPKQREFDSDEDAAMDWLMGD
ncbi:FHA domain-containing protein [Planctomicrobium piriforme]|uniref:Adenylate cyclase n=1 Tax=Planctomicrobium piriforme TaxID=1576369 RepID=A0A1I3B7W6_9PLAN|nr:FHA domain-containing protein [Planctomicrobium piriforme]SFH58393.1 adenylate cyclase [Planctomicrobium piriforme]